ncbi:unnamed protein product [Adineta ricciae]|uniref:EGF-like domain-containing protein n=1 Tax=Adineta ricciae TaxID=249248 RepID=A0A815QGL9_ADIRI|nr:unnamed protein product [Adineta ricciae]CAF1462970.1 unnamed protein product [Adineta ricciae]
MKDLKKTYIVNGNSIRLANDGRTREDVVSVYEHKQNRSRLFIPPLALLNLNNTKILYRQLDKQDLLRISLILSTNELRQTILQYLSDTHLRCNRSQELCEVKMIPTELFRIVWSRSNPFSSDYSLDSSWQSNTALLNNVNVFIECSTNKTCSQLLNNILQTPDILNGLEFEYSTQTDKQTRKTVTITGQHVMKTQIYLTLKQLSSSTANDHERYLLADDVNQFATEILTTMELEELTDSDYISQSDQNVLIQMLKSRLKQNRVTLDGHMKQQWNSVYWNQDSIRPNRIVQLLNDELQQLQKASNPQNKGNQIDEEYRTHTTRSKSFRVNVGIGKFCAALSISPTKADAVISSDSPADQGNRSVRNTLENLHVTSDDMSIYNENAWRRAACESEPTSQEQTEMSDEAQSFEELRQKNYDFYANNRQFIEFKDDKFIVKPIEVYRLNLANYNEHSKIVHKNIIITRIESVHTVPVRILSSPSSGEPINASVVDRHSNVLVSKLDELSRKLGAIENNMKKSQSNTDKQLRELKSSYRLLSKVSLIDNHTNLLESSLHTLQSSLAAVKNDSLNVKAYVEKLHERLESLETLNDSSSENLQPQPTNQFEEVSSSIKTLENNMEKLQSTIEKRLAELQVSEAIAKNTVDKLTLYTNLSSPFVGEIKLYSGQAQSLPPNWVFCHGQALSRMEYRRLFFVLGDSFGAGNGHSTFNLPDLRDRVVIGQNPGENGTVDAYKTDSTNDRSKYTLITTELPDRTSDSRLSFSLPPYQSLHYIIFTGDQSVNITNSNNVSIITPTAHSVCPLQCLNGGSCLSANVCICMPPWAGSQCEHKKMKFVKWEQNATTVAGGNTAGDKLNQLNSPKGIFIDRNKNIFIADQENHRIMKWKVNESQGIVAAGGNGWGNRPDQLNLPTDVIVYEQNHSLIIADAGNRRVIQWFDQQHQEILVQNITCVGLAIDRYGFLYVSDYAKHEVRRWKMSDVKGRDETVVAGGNGAGGQLNQLNSPGFIFVDDEQSIYISDYSNHRVVKWRKDAKEGIVVVAGGNDHESILGQLYNPGGLVVDDYDHIYVADYSNHRIMRWIEGKAESEVVVGGNGEGEESNQFDIPIGLSFDLEGNLYVSDFWNHRIQRFDLIS